MERPCEALRAWEGFSQGLGGQAIVCRRTDPRRRPLEKPASQPTPRGQGLVSKQPVLVARRTSSGTGPIVGAAATVAVLWQGCVKTFRHRGRGA